MAIGTYEGGNPVTESDPDDRSDGSPAGTARPATILHLRSLSPGHRRRNGRRPLRGGRPVRPPEEDVEIHVVEAGIVPMTAQDEREAIDILAEILIPRVQEILAQRDATERRAA